MRALSTILLLLFFESAFSQAGNQLQYRFQHWSQADGLTGNTVMKIAQDAKGYIWINTLHNGIQRYDGVRFQDFRDSLRKADKNFSIIHQLSAQDGFLFLEAENKLYRYNYLQKTFKPYDYKKAGKKKDFFWDKEGNEWTLFDKVIVRFNKKENRIDFELPLLDNFIEANSPIAFDSTNNQYWLMMKNSILLLDVKSGKIIEENDNPHTLLFYNIRQKTPTTISSMILDNQQNLWLSGWDDRLFRYNLTTKKIKIYSLEDIRDKQSVQKGTGPLLVSTFFIDNHHQFWLGTYGLGLLKYNSKADVFDYLITDESDAKSLQYNYEIKCLFQDQQQNIWVGTDRGISIFNPYKDFFKVISNQKGAPVSLPYNEITAVFQSSNKDIWIGTWGGGITLLDSNLNLKKHHVFKSNKANLVWCFAEDDKGRIWTGNQHGLINRYDPKQNKFDSFYFNNNRFTIKCMTKDSKGNILLGLHNGTVAKWESATGKFIDYNFGNHQYTPEFPVIHLFADNHHNIWVNNGKGLYRFDSDKMIFTDSIFMKENSGRIIYPSPGIAVNQFNDSILLVGCLDGGGAYLNMNTGKMEKWLLKEELRTKKISAIRRDHAGDIWFTADNYLYKFTPGREEEATNYFSEKKPLNSSFTSEEFVELQDGNWVTFTNSEVVFFRPRLLSNDQSNRPVTITGIKIFNKHILIDSLWENNIPLTLKPNQNFITIEFAPLLFSFIHKKKYLYKLSGINQNWMAADDNFSASYTSLKPGKYTFSVKAAGDSPDMATHFQIIITPPFYKTWWFFILIFVAIASVFWISIKRRIRIIRKEATLKQRILETEMAALRAQMNPHFIFNCLSAIDSLIQTNEKDKATTYLARFARLIRNVLDSSKNNVIPFHKDLETTKLFIDLERFRSNNKFNYELDADQELIDGDFKVPPLLIQPFIENAIHHGLFNKNGCDKLLKIQIRLNGNFIIYTIHDNGVGRKKAGELKQINRPDHVSYGIQISNERIRNYNYPGFNEQKKSKEYEDLSISDLYIGNKPAGTLVEIKLKIDSVN